MTNSSNGIETFRIDIPQSALDDLAERVHRTRWRGDLSGAGWERGVPTDYLRRLARYWVDGFDWRAAEARLNSLPQFTTEVDGQRLHFLHVRSADPDAVPLLLLHGWPSSPVEFLDVIEPLTDPRADDADSPAFHLVIPSLPGFGFSGPLSETGWTDDRVATALATLMERLGYDRYGVQGGDVGAIVAPKIARRFPRRVIGVHVNGLITFPTGDPADMAALTESERERLKGMQHFKDDMSGYMQLLGTRPLTVAQALADSPVGQLAWIVEKYKEWTDPRHELPEDAVDRDRLLTNVSIYWFTDTAASVANSYYERFHAWGAEDPSPVPTGVAVFPTDYSVRRFAEGANKITHWAEYYEGGHFAAQETPRLLAADVREFFSTL